MGDTLSAATGSEVTITISFKSPDRNNHGDPVAVNHIDLIAGEMADKVARLLADGITPNPDYEKDGNKTTRVIATFSGKDWQPAEGSSPAGGNSWRTVSYHVRQLRHDMYFRLRGTNLRCGGGETDGECNPLADELQGANNQDKAYADLWFYSNPIFVRVSR